MHAIKIFQFLSRFGYDAGAATQLFFMRPCLKLRLQRRRSALAFSLELELERTPTISEERNGYNVGDRVGVGARRSASSAFSMEFTAIGWLQCRRSGWRTNAPFNPFTPFSTFQVTVFIFITQYIQIIRRLQL